MDDRDEEFGEILALIERLGEDADLIVLVSLSAAADALVDSLRLPEPPRQGAACDVASDVRALVERCCRRASEARSIADALRYATAARHLLAAERSLAAGAER